MAVTQADIDTAKQDRRNRKNQEDMETEIYGKPVTTPSKPSKPIGEIPGAVNLPGKPRPEPKDWKDIAPPLPNAKPLPKGKKFEDYMKPLRKGGYVKAADGIAKKGKTKGRIL